MKTSKIFPEIVIKLLARLGSGPVPGGEQGDDLADGRLSGPRLGYRQVGLDLVAVAAAVFLRDHVAGLGQVGDERRSVMPRLAAMSRSLAPGS